MIEARSLHKSYGRLKAVDDVSFSISEGEAFGLLGPNGAGKSTTIAMLVGLLRPDQGTVIVNGRSDPTDPDLRHSIGIATQSLSLYDELSARENLAFFAGLYGLTGPKLSERIMWALEFSGLNERASSRVSTYSGGMKRRLNLACALVHEPKIILLDEPTVGVDPQSRNHIFESIERLKEHGLTVIYTTHYMEEAERLCDRVAIMDRGKLLALDTVDALVRQHGGRSVVTAKLGTHSSDVDLPGAFRDGVLRFESQEPLEDVTRLAGQGVVFCSLQISRPDLETVFLTLTGRSLRDD